MVAGAAAQSEAAEGMALVGGFAAAVDVVVAVAEFVAGVESAYAAADVVAADVVAVADVVAGAAASSEAVGDVAAAVDVVVAAVAPAAAGCVLAKAEQSWMRRSNWADHPILSPPDGPPEVAKTSMVGRLLDPKPLI